MGNTRRVLNGDNATVHQLRPAAPTPSTPASVAATAVDTAPAETPPAESTESNGAEPESNGAEPTDSNSTEPTDSNSTEPNRRRRDRFAHALRRVPPPRQVAAAIARAVGAWSRRPGGRLVLPGLLLLLLVSASGTAGALLVPAAAPVPRPSGTQDPVVPDAPGVPAGSGVPTAAITPTPNPPGGTPGRPSDVLAGWAQQVGNRVGIPPVAMQAYGYAEWVVSQTTPSCKLSWTTLAAIGKVESDHGRFNGAVLGADGQVRPNIIGLPLDGQGDRQRITDTDQGLLDGDTVYDRAVGPMQFIPSTWRQEGVDADEDGIKNPQDIDDAALAAANYLCKGGRDLSKPQDWWNAILSYNNVQSYAQQVFDTANQYGTASRS